MKYEYNEALKLLTSEKKFRIELGLDRMREIMKLLGNPQDELNCIHVAGTNGKGSVCAILSSILKETGQKIGLYTSPHLFKYNERIQINSNPISDNDFSNYVFKVIELADKNDIDLTEFEILTAVMFKYFADNEVDIAILETGLGGRFDATNIIKKNLCAVITHVDLDHTERLGDTIDKIAFEKAGIIKPNCPCIVFEGKEIYYDAADKQCALLEVISPYADTTDLALKGINQQENLALALAVVNKLFPQTDAEIIKRGLRGVKHPARFQYIPDKNIVIDGAHNPNGINSLVQNLDYYFPNKERRYIFGCLRNKDYKTMLNTLLKEGDEVYFRHFNHANSCTYEELNLAAKVSAKQYSKDTNINFKDGKITVICGSLYMIKEITEDLNINIF